MSSACGVAHLARGCPRHHYQLPRAMMKLGWAIGWRSVLAGFIHRANRSAIWSHQSFKPSSSSSPTPSTTPPLPRPPHPPSTPPRPLPRFHLQPPHQHPTTMISSYRWPASTRLAQSVEGAAVVGWLQWTGHQGLTWVHGLH